MKFALSKKYAVLSIGLIAVEISIALFIHDRLIRPFVGDMLVVILIFTLCRTVIETGYLRLTLCVLTFSFAVEIGQYFNLISLLGLQHSKLARIIIGATFDFHDLLAYSAGALLICIIGSLRWKMTMKAKLCLMLGLTISGGASDYRVDSSRPDVSHSGKSQKITAAKSIFG
jgi:hypothetical protein